MSRHSLAQCISLACVLEATAPKPGNVHRGADFEDLSFTEFLTAGIAIAEPLAEARKVGVGPAILNAVRATRSVSRSNVNLGIVLLLGPLAAVRPHESLISGVKEVLANLGPADAAAIWEAIRIAQPGGLGNAAQYDVMSDSAPSDLLVAMREASERDLIAKQYANGYDDVFFKIVKRLIPIEYHEKSLTRAIIETQLRFMAETPDSLIARKCGKETAREASAHAAAVLASGSWSDENFHAALADFDFWLRADGHKRNPGATADLIAAGLFTLLRHELIDPPYL